MDKRKYDEPESKEETRSKAVAYLLLAALVVLILFLISTGTVQIF